MRRHVYHDADNLDTAFDAGGKVSIGLTATTIVSQWTWSATLLQSSTVASKVIFHCSADGRSENMWVRGAQGVFLLCQLWIINYHVKIYSNNLSNENLNTCVDKT